MALIDSLMSQLDERTIAGRIGIVHDEARMQYHLNSNTVSNFSQFRNIITDYYNYHYSRCVIRGGSLPSMEAYSRAKQLLENEYRKRGGDINTAVQDAIDGTNGGMRGVLDILADGLKAEVVERYITDLFDRYIAPNSWDQQVEIIRQFITYTGHTLSGSVDTGKPEKYARDYSSLIRSYTDGLQRTSAMFRRL